MIRHSMAGYWERSLRFSEPNELSRHYSSLVQELVERVLAISARLSKDNLACLERCRSAIESDSFTITFHWQLLDMFCKGFKCLRVGQNSHCSMIQDLSVEYSNQAQQNRKILLKRWWLEVLVHALSSS